MTPEQWVVFRLDASEFALPLRSVVEVLRMVTIRAVPQAPAWLVGLINLRGRALPVMDLRPRIGLAPQAPRLNTRILVVELGGHWIGLLADDVVEVLTQPAAVIDVPDALQESTSRVFAAVQSGGRLISVFDLDRLGVGTDLSALARL